VVLNSTDGTDYDLDAGKAVTQKEVVFVGGNNSELLAAQERLLALGVYPEGLELGTLATLGSLINYHAFAQLKSPTLVLEIDPDNTQSFIITADGLDATRAIPQGLEAMIPVVQKELNLKDEESARKLFFSNTFDFTNMGVMLVKKLIKELQSLIGFYEVQTGQSIGQVVCTQIPPKLAWLSNIIAKELGVGVLKLDLADWLKSHQITFTSPPASSSLDPRWLGLLSLMVFHDAVAATKK
jgi:Tfp pilus assembly PilM family ATPase